MTKRLGDEAVADVMGSVLMVGITVIMTVALSMLVANMPGPPDETYAELKITAGPGADLSWGTGDERIMIQHLYGEPIPQSKATVAYTVNDGGVTMTGAELGFSDGTLDIGERWIHQTILQHNDELHVNVVVPHGTGNRLMTSTALITGEANCSTDNDPPHAIITQNPANAEALTGAQPIHIAALIVDTCNAVDETVIPNLFYEVGTHTATIQMTNVGIDRFEAFIPAPSGSWATVVLQTLDYQVQNMRDTMGNSGNSPINSDFIDPIPPDYHYVDGTTPYIGSILDFANMRSAADGGAATTLAEGLDGSGNTVSKFYANGLVSMGADWDKEERAYGGGLELDDEYASYDKNLDAPIRFTQMDPGPTSDAINKVVLKGEGYIDTWIDDGWQLQGCTSVGCTVISGIQSGWLIESTNQFPNEEAVFEFDVTGLRPGGGSWTWQDIQELEIQVTPRIVFTPAPGPGTEADGEWNLDSTWAEVTHGPGYDMNIEFNWDNVEILGNHDLEINYRVSKGHFQVEVWDGLDWNPRASAPLTAGSFTKWIDPLTLAEFNNGDPIIRIVSKQTQPNQQGTVTIDYMRVTY